MITSIRISQHLTAGQLTADHVGRYIVIRPKGSTADVMGRLNSVLQFPYTHSTNVELENAHLRQSIWVPVTPSPPYGLHETDPVALIEGFEEQIAPSAEPIPALTSHQQLRGSSH